MMAMGFSVAVVAMFALIASECVKTLRRDLTALFVAMGLAFGGSKYLVVVGTIVPNSYMTSFTCTCIDLCWMYMYTPTANNIKQRTIKSYECCSSAERHRCIGLWRLPHQRRATGAAQRGAWHDVQRVVVVHNLCRRRAV